MVHAEAVDFEAGEACGDRLLDPRVVGGRAAQGALLVTDAVVRDIWYETARCLIQMSVTSAGSRVILPDFVLRDHQQQHRQ